MRRGVLIATFVVITLVACNTEKRRLLARVGELERQQTIQKERTERRRDVLLDLEQQLASVNSELTQQNNNARAYLMQHRTAAACIRAANITFSDDADSSPAAGAAGWGTVLCTVALLDQGFAREVTEAANRIEEAGQRRRELKTRITGVERAIEVERSRIRDDESALDRLDMELADVRHQLSLQ